MLAPVRIAAPKDTPVTLDEVKKHLRVDGTDEDSLIAGLIDATTDYLDGWSGILGRALVTQSWQQDFGCFETPLRLALGPVSSVSQVLYYDGANEQQTLDPEGYELLTDAGGDYLAPAIDATWPATYRRANAVRVEYVAGTAAEDMPPALRAALLLHIAHLYENREAASDKPMTALPLGVAALIAPYTRTRI
jgi:uncharacterized phiE125 gp8 family phage protein